jgi:hypothetical protein
MAVWGLNRSTDPQRDSARKKYKFYYLLAINDFKISTFVTLQTALSAGGKEASLSHKTCCDLSLHNPVLSQATSVTN